MAGKNAFFGGFDLCLLLLITESSELDVNGSGIPLALLQDIHIQLTVSCKTGPLPSGWVGYGSFRTSVEFCSKERGRRK